MNTPEVRPENYVQFLLASPLQFTCMEAARVQPQEPDPPAHDAFNRLLTRLEPDPEALWAEARPRSGPVRASWSWTTPPWTSPTPARWAWSAGTGRATTAVVKGINLLTLLWTDGDRHVPCDYRLADKANDGLSKNDHFGQLLRAAHDRGFRPECVCFDGWYGSLENLKRSAPWAGPG